MKKSHLFLLLSIIGLQSIKAEPKPDFDWGNANVYFVITDRFANGDPSNDINYGRITDYGSERLNAATFHGGDFKGMLQKAGEGYFKELGIDVVWMTDVYEQIHGWMSGSGSINDFPHYGYHGYYPLDYTQIDKNYGTVEEFRSLVDELHRQGIRVMLGANLNDPATPLCWMPFSRDSPIPDCPSRKPPGIYATGVLTNSLRVVLNGKDGMTAVGYVCPTRVGMSQIRSKPLFSGCPILRMKAMSR